MPRLLLGMEDLEGEEDSWSLNELVSRRNRFLTIHNRQRNTTEFYDPEKEWHVGRSDWSAVREQTKSNGSDKKGPNMMHMHDWISHTIAD